MFSLKRRSRKPNSAVRSSQQEFRDIRRDLEYLHGTPLSKIDRSDEELNEAIDILRDEGLIITLFVNGELIYYRTRKAEHGLEMMELGELN